MKDKKNKTGKNKKNKTELKSPAVPVPPAASELSEQDLKRVTGGAVDTFIKKGIVDKY